MTYDEIKAAWNAQADDGNRWHSLSEAEKIEWAAIHQLKMQRVACLWQHTLTGQRKVLMDNDVFTAGPHWRLVGPLFLATVEPDNCCGCGPSQARKAMP